MEGRYQTLIITPLLEVIEKYQDFLCQPENLPQLAKLGFMFNKLWYAGRICYGYDGIVEKDDSCENNPKYEIGDSIKYNSEKNENLVYDAWGMHVSNHEEPLSFEGFKNLILNGRELSNFEIQCRKPNKTFDEWVSIMTDRRYPYHSLFPNRRAVADHLLCVIGNGYGYNDQTGMVIKEASGADQDEDIYGVWENSHFIPEIQEIINSILNCSECQISMDKEYEFILEINHKEEEKRNEMDKTLNSHLLSLINKAFKEKGKPEITEESNDFKEIKNDYLEIRTKELLGMRGKEKQYDYYPICEYSIITKLDDESEYSYIKAGLDISHEILCNPNSDSYKNNKKFAEDFIERFSRGETTEDLNQIPNKISEQFKNINQLFN